MKLLYNICFVFSILFLNYKQGSGQSNVFTLTILKQAINVKLVGDKWAGWDTLKVINGSFVKVDFDKELITVNDNPLFPSLQQKYKIINVEQEVIENRLIFTYSCLDMSNKSCIASLLFPPKNKKMPIVFGIMYTELGYRYELQQIKKSN